MIKQIIALSLCFVSLSVMSQSLWLKSDANLFRYADEEDIMILPKKFEAYTLDLSTLKSQLLQAPHEDAKIAGEDGLTILLPLDDGSFESFEMYESPVMAKELGDKYPMIKSYKGVSTSAGNKNIRLDIGTYGLHGAIFSPEKTTYIDPYARGNESDYIVYDVKDHISQLDIDTPLCGVDDDAKFEKLPSHTSSSRSGENIPLRVYRFALACTGEWGAIRGTVEKALSDMNTGVNRLNQIFENELAMRLVLVAENDQLLNFQGTGDPYNVVSSGGAMLSVNTGVINSKIGAGKYDLGHVYHTNCDVGGIAALGSMCNSNKGAGVTCHYSNNLDYMAASVTSHEIGHQMSAQHTFNNCDGQNESLGNGFEPGSGSTIMSYGGLCGPDKNVQSGSDDYYHVASLMQIYSHLRDGGTADACAVLETTSNFEPDVFIDLPNDFTIPEDTYFYLEGRATDANPEDILTYSWEGFNAGPLSPLGSPIAGAPRFRSVKPSTSPIRYFPSPDNILANTFDRTEVLPQGNMELNFVFTTRDNNSEAGTAVWKELVFFSAPTTEKFLVTSQSTQMSFEVGDQIEVTWTVGGTDKAPFNSPFVDILFNTNTQASFDIYDMTYLAKNVPNNGSAIVTIPNEITNTGRIIVKASDGIFFTINSRNMQVKAPVNPSIYFDLNPLSQRICLPENSSVQLTSTAFAGLEGDVTYSIASGLPDDVVVTFDKEVSAPGEIVNVNFDFANAPNSAVYNVEIQAIVEGVDTFTRPFTIYVTDNDHSLLAGSFPENGALGVSLTPSFEWTPSPNAESYAIEVATSPAFGNSTVVYKDALTNNTFSSNTLLEKSTVYYWRLIPTNDCGEGTSSQIFSFSTEVLTCSEIVPATGVLPINITQSGTPTIEVPIVIDAGGQVADINIPLLQGTHNRNKDLVVSLISPAGTQVKLFSKICEQKNFNCAFDDESNVDVKCPLNNGSTYKPIEALANFNGESMVGTWILKIEDTASGNGGVMENVELQICTNQAFKNPFLVRNEPIRLLPLEMRTIVSVDLTADDEDNTKDELIFTLVTIPQVGVLMLDDEILVVGSQFSQADIDANKLSYTAINDQYFTGFDFTVIDGEGGFVGNTRFEIEVREPNSTEETALASGIKVFPNPTSGIVTIDASSLGIEIVGGEVVDVNGRVLQAFGKIEHSKSLDLSGYGRGIYFVRLQGEEAVFTAKLIVR